MFKLILLFMSQLALASGDEPRNNCEILGLRAASENVVEKIYPIYRKTGIRNWFEAPEGRVQLKGLDEIFVLEPEAYKVLKFATTTKLFGKYLMTWTTARQLLAIIDLHSGKLEYASSSYTGDLKEIKNEEPKNLDDFLIQTKDGGHFYYGSKGGPGYPRTAGQIIFINPQNEISYIETPFFPLFAPKVLENSLIFNVTQTQEGRLHILFISVENNLRLASQFRFNLKRRRTSPQPSIVKVVSHEGGDYYHLAIGGAKTGIGWVSAIKFGESTDAIVSGHEYNSDSFVFKITPDGEITFSK